MVNESGVSFYAILKHMWASSLLPGFELVSISCLWTDGAGCTKSPALMQARCWHRRLRVLTANLKAAGEARLQQQFSRQVCHHGQSLIETVPHGVDPRIGGSDKPRDLRIFGRRILGCQFVERQACSDPGGEFDLPGSHLDGWRVDTNDEINILDPSCRNRTKSHNLATR